MKEKLKIATIGLGRRGRSQLGIMSAMPDVQIMGISDKCTDKLFMGINIVKELQGNVPLATTDHRDLLDRKDIDAILVYTGWNEHIPLCIEIMESGKYAAMEVGGANSIEECWELVRTSERTKMPCMMLENCCFGRSEMTVLNMVKQGLFGHLSHAEGGYLHDLREHISLGYLRDHFRHPQNLLRNGDLYPTHGLGPICTWLDINRGNRMLTLTSTSSAANGLNAWVESNRGIKHPMATGRFAEGDVTTTVIKCARGETITLTHNTSLPRPYSRKNLLQGTKGIYMEDKNGAYIEGYSNNLHAWDSMDKFYKLFEHPLWIDYREGGKLAQNTAGHGGMDYLVQRAFFEAVKNGTQTPIDVYDTAAWAAITCLSEDSVAQGGHPVPIPDFTNGKWFTRKDVVKGPYSLNAVFPEYFR